LGFDHPLLTFVENDKSPFCVQLELVGIAAKPERANLCQLGVAKDRIEQRSRQALPAKRLIHNHIVNRSAINEVRKHTTKCDEAILFVRKTEHKTAVLKHTNHVVELPIFGPPFLLVKLKQLIDVLVFEVSDKLGLHGLAHVVYEIQFPIGSVTTFDKNCSPDCTPIYRVHRRVCPKIILPQSQ